MKKQHNGSKSNVSRAPEDIKYGTLKRPARTLDFNSGSVFPSNGKVPHTSIYKTTPML